MTNTRIFDRAYADLTNHGSQGPMRPKLVGRVLRVKESRAKMLLTLLLKEGVATDGYPFVQLRQAEVRSNYKQVPVMVGEVETDKGQANIQLSAHGLVTIQSGNSRWERYFRSSEDAFEFVGEMPSFVYEDDFARLYGFKRS